MTSAGQQRPTARRLLLAALLGLAAGAQAAPAAGALERPAVMAKAPQRAALLSAAWAGQRIVAVGERGIVVTSEDGGQHWQQVASPVSVTLTTVRFATPTDGVAVGHGGTVLTTQDGGASWKLRLDGRRLATLVRDEAQAAGASPEAARDAERLVADGPDKPLLDVLLLDRQRLLAVGAFGLAVYSADGGQTWQSWMSRLPNPKGLHWYAARRDDDTLLLAGEQGLLARSDDGGQSFQPLASPYKGSWFAAELLPQGRIVLAGLRGQVWQSSDRGERWTPVANPVPATVTAMTPWHTDGLLLASQSGALLRLQGDRLQPVSTQPLALPAGLLPLPHGRLLALGLTGVNVLSLPSERKPAP